MAKPIALAKDIAFAFPNVCPTTIPPAPTPVPIPYPSIAQLSDASPVSDTGKALFVKGTPVLLENSEVTETSGDEPADPGTKSRICEISQASASVFFAGKGIVRFGDQTAQNQSNAVGTVLSGEPCVLVGD
ncbi:MAG: putative Zn-binding protein involved in type VI secretion [Patiriisocius sp.]|jgi:uncharacterized Zn-binding protein involved in type VI secretion